MHTRQLTIKQTATGYWVIERGATAVAGAMTRASAEAERDMLNGLRGRTVRRTRRRSTSARGARVPATGR